MSSTSTREPGRPRRAAKQRMPRRGALSPRPVLHDNRAAAAPSTRRTSRADVRTGRNAAPIYLDYSATTRSIARRRRDGPWLRNHFGNPARAAMLGWEARRPSRTPAPRSPRSSTAIARTDLDVRRDGVDQLAIKGVATSTRQGRHLVTVKTEHKATLDTMRESSAKASR